MAENMSLDVKLIDVFCATFGEQYRGTLNARTSMDDIPEWDSLRFLDLVFAIEDAFGVSFTEAESAQMFQLGHIQRMIDHARLDLPHDDVAHACCQIHAVRSAGPAPFTMVLLSGSSTREGLLTHLECRDMLRALSGRADAAWANISVSGLVVAETLQLMEVIGPLGGVLAIGYSPVIFAGCGQAEFNRSAVHERFPFAAPMMDRVLLKHGYTVTRPEDIRPSVPVETWVRRYLKDRKMEELQYNSYIYPTLAPWPAAKYHDEEAILRYYNRSILNFENSMQVNAELFEEIAVLAKVHGTPLALVELTVHSALEAYLERLGRIVSRSEEFRRRFCQRHSVPYIKAASSAGLTDADYRDPAHVYRSRDRYTRALIAGVLDLVKPQAAFGNVGR